ncbi:DNA-processing protein DprA [Bartonella tamiae]|uniref:DNA protecting protein DprA n=1 Tax=Bartonella tamiae Th239 TaxID=1094558 RepID=J0ZSC6_9HYPH|nr:DNA protecting protein DprA [Bartonella tamiae Th239]
MNYALDIFNAYKAISPRIEMGAYEAMWLEKGASFKSIAQKFLNDKKAMPSDLVSESEAEKCAKEVIQRFYDAGINKFGIRINKAGDYPTKLRDAVHPIELLYYQGDWELTEAKSFAIVGSRDASELGQRRAAHIAKELVQENYIVVSGLAKGIDTAAHKSAINNGGHTIAVIGTPLNSNYPKENSDLQKNIANNHLLISQVPVLRYSKQGPQQNRLFFPERNATMSALTIGTIIVEAGQTSGSLTQARAALKQGRKLFILNSCFERTDITWPRYYEERGAIRVHTMDDIWGNID